MDTDLKRTGGRPDARLCAPRAKTLTLALACAVLSPMLFLGCVSKMQYDNDVGRLAEALQAERAMRAAEVASLEKKNAERGRTLNELTERIMLLQREKDASFGKFGLIRDDIVTLKRGLEELRLVVLSNSNTMQGREMLLKINEMLRELNGLLGKFPAGDGPS